MDLNPTLLTANVGILARPACDRPLHSNGDRLAHRHGQFSRSPTSLTLESGYGQGFSLSLFVRGLLVRGRVNRPMSVYLSTHTGTPPRKSTSP